MTRIDDSIPTATAHTEAQGYYDLAIRARCSRLRAMAGLAAMAATWVAGTLVVGAVSLAVFGFGASSDEATASPSLFDDMTDSPGFFIVMMANVICAFLPAGIVGGCIVTRRSPLRLWSVRGPFRVRLFLASTGIAAVTAVVLSAVTTAVSGTLPSEPVLTAQSSMLVLAVLLMVPVQSLGEEIFLRGALVQALTVLLPHGTVKRRRGAIICSSVIGALLFALLHGPSSIPHLVMYAVGALALYVMTAWLAGVEGSTGAHTAMNIVLFVPMVLEMEFAAVLSWQMVVQVAAFDVLAATAIGLLCRRWRGGRMGVG